MRYAVVGQGYIAQGGKNAANDEHHTARKAPAARTRRKTTKTAASRKAA